MSPTTGGADTAMQQLYQQLILDHSRRREGYGLLGEPDDAAVHGHSHQKNPVCGDECDLQVRLARHTDTEGRPTARLEGLGWEGSGCSISQASLSVMCGLLAGCDLREIAALEGDFRTLMHARGKGVDDATADRLEDATAFEGVAKFPARIKCALLGWSAVRDAITSALQREDLTDVADEYRPAS